MDSPLQVPPSSSTLGAHPHYSLLQLRRVLEAYGGGAASQPIISALSQMADGQETLSLCFNFSQDADAEVFSQIVSHTRHPLDVNMNDAAFNPPNARMVLAALLAAGPRLHKLSLRGSWLGRTVLKSLLQSGLCATQLDLSNCKNLRGKLAFQGDFTRLRTLVLDANPGIQNLTQASFPSLPQLTSLSLCGSNLSNLWTTCAALTHLTTLRQLCFQRCACCVAGTAACTGRPGPGHVQPRQARPHKIMPLQMAAPMVDEDSFEEYSPASLPPLFDDDSTPMLVESSESGQAVDEMEEGEEGEVFRTPRPFLSRELLDLTERLQEEDAPPDEPFFSPLLRANSSMSTDSGASSLALGNAWDELEADTCRLMLDGGEQGAAEGAGGEAGPSHRWRERQGEAAEMRQEAAGERRAEQRDYDEGGAARHIGRGEQGGAAEPDAAAGREAPGNEGFQEGEEREAGSEERVDAGSKEQAGSVEVSPICNQSHYRAFMLVQLPQLQVLDNQRITAAEKEQAHRAYREHFEPHPNGAGQRGCILSAVHRREVGACGRPPSATAFRRSLGGAAAGRSVWPAMSAVSSIASPVAETRRRYRPRQFEYSPNVAGLMVVGTLSGEVVVLNHETESLVGAVQTIGAPHSILGLSWLNIHPAKLIAGCDNGSIQLFDVDKMRASLLLAARRNPRSAAPPFAANTAMGRHAAGWMGGAPAYAHEAAAQTFANFDQLTSVHVNCTDQFFLASGYSSHIGLYDIGTGKRLQIFEDLHREHINVLKFAHHSPSLFVTSSFDKDIKMWDLRMPALHPLYTTQSRQGNVMCCFSPDDQYILSSAVDNEVRQHLVSDGRLHLAFDLAPTGSTHNYTRSYYMNGRDYIITGSCEENVVRVCCARTGRRLRDVTLEGRAVKGSLYVQSLRGDPFRDFHFSVLAAYNTPNARSEIVKVNLLSKGEAKTGRIHTEIDDDVALGA